jgi:diguanylate cyclase (GGDEF)-like protein/PAS domain S-box-containing protein
MLVMDASGRIVQVNALAEQLFGYRRETLISQFLNTLIAEGRQSRHRQLLTAHLHDLLACSRGGELELQGLRQNGSQFTAQARFSAVQTPTGPLILAAIRDITPYQQVSAMLHEREATLRALLNVTAERLQKAKRALQMHRECTQTLVRASKEDELLHAICRIIVEVGGYRLAWVGLAEHDAEKTVRPSGQAGYEEGYLESARITWSATEGGCQPTGTAIRTGQPAIARDLVTDPDDVPWRVEALKRGYASSIALPLCQEGQAFGALNIYATESDAFDPREVCLLSKLADDLAYGMVALRLRADRQRAEAALRVSEERYRSLVDTSPYAIIIHQEGRLVFVNPAGMLLLRASDPQQLIGKPILQFIHPEGRNAAQDCSERLLTGKTGLYPSRDRYVRLDGSLVAVEVTVVPLIYRGRPAIQVIALDITARQRAEEALFKEKERAQVTLHSIGDAVTTTDIEGLIDYLNPVAEMLTGWTNVEAQGQPLSEVFKILNERSRQPVPDPVARCLREGRIVRLANHSVLLSRSGQEYAIADSAAPIRGRDGQILGAVLVFHDVSETRRLTRQMAHDASHDALTGLINRREFERRLERALASARQYGRQHALCYLDLDQFKLVNDTVGHPAGDELLKQIKGLVAGSFRERDTLARLGGDEFGLLLDNCPLAHAQLIAQALVSSIHDYRFVWQGHSFQIGVSVGLVPITADTQDTAQLLSQADVACYTAKELGRNRVHVYQQADSEPAQRHGEILRAARLRDALEHERFRLYCQPIVALTAPATPLHYELLLRLLDDRGELLLPAAFIPAAERYGLMGAIDRWVIRTALQHYAQGGVPRAKITLNLSGNSLNDDTLLEFVQAQFTEFAVAPEQVCFEITETAAIHNLRKTTALMGELKQQGSQLALDDFGSGLSSFRYLKSLPVDYLKIDGSFVRDMLANAGDHAMVVAINQLGHTMGMQTIAEYVESALLIERLQELGVDYAQGYALGAPQPWSTLQPEGLP